MNTNNNTQLAIYQTPNGEAQLDVTVKGDTIWLTQRQIADLFGTKVPAISKHLKNIFASGELERGATISKMETVVNRGFRGSSVEVVDHYNLDAMATSALQPPFSSGFSMEMESCIMRMAQNA